MGQQQLLLLVLSTVIVGLATVAGIQAFSENQSQAAQDALVQRATEVATDIQAADAKPAQLGGLTIGNETDSNGDPETDDDGNIIQKSSPSEIAKTIGIPGDDATFGADGAGDGATCEIGVDGTDVNITCDSNESNQEVVVTYDSDAGSISTAFNSSTLP